MAKPVPAPSKPPKPAPPALDPDDGFWPKDIGEGDFFRMRREANGWRVEMVRLTSDRKSVASIRRVHAWDRYEMTARRLEQLATESDRAHQ